MTPKDRERRLAQITALYQYHLQERRLGDRTMSGHAGQALRQAKQLASTLIPRKDSDHGTR